MMSDDCASSNNNNKQNLKNLLFCVNKTKCEIGNKNFQTRQIVACCVASIWIIFSKFFDFNLNNESVSLIDKMKNCYRSQINSIVCALWLTDWAHALRQTDELGGQSNGTAERTSKSERARDRDRKGAASERYEICKCKGSTTKSKSHSQLKRSVW